jgi:hypothetical protein
MGTRGQHVMPSFIGERGEGWDLSGVNGGPEQVRRKPICNEDDH